MGLSIGSHPESPLHVHPMTQVLQEYPEMTSRSDEYEKMSAVAPIRKIQMFIRKGKAELAFERWRRDPEAWFINGSG
jgi:hypothetical protein